MCRPTVGGGLPGVSGFTMKHDRLNIRAFYLRISVAGGRTPLSDALTLVYLPRVDGNLLEVNGHRVPAEAPAIVPLHRIVHPAELPRVSVAEAVFASTDRVRAGEGVRFDAYIGEDRFLRGVFRWGGGWEMDLRSAAEGDEAGVVAAAEAWVMGEKGVAMRQRVEVAAEEAEERRRRRRRRRGFCLKLEEIPEEREGCDCLCCDGGEEEEEEEGWEMVGSEGGDLKGWGGKGMDGEDVELAMEGVKWAVDVGIWVMCLGVGLLVSKASYKNLLRKLM